jgi:dipeptidyl aminopeptidase/acylaminoacyl peptidase
MLGFTSRTPDPRYDHAEERWQAPRRIDTFFTRLDDEGWVTDRPRHVYVVPVDGTSPARNLTPGPWQHRGIAWLTDSNALVTCAARHEGWDRDLAEDLYVVPLHGEPRPLTSRTGVYHSPAVSPDGRSIGFIDRTFNPTGAIVSVRWDGADQLLALAEDRGRCHVVRLSVDGGEPSWATEGDGVVKGFDLAGGTLAFSAADVMRPAEVFVQRDGRELRLSTVTDRYAGIARPSGWERFGVPTADGTAEIDAWIMRPRGFDPARQYPVLLNVHGGPHTQYGETYFDEAQLQSAAGFVVVMSNPRGSSGREQRWGQAIMGPKHPVAPGTGWGGVDVDDVMAVLDAAVERYPFCDPDRVGMLGGSYGGWMATELAGRFGARFRAICSERAVNNLLTEEWSSDIGTVFRVEHGVDPIAEPDEYWRMSPVRRAADIHVPMLLLHSEDDLRCPINQAEELFVVLRWLGRDVTFYRFPGEGHELSRSGSPVHRVQRAEIILDWFTDRLATAPDPPRLADLGARTPAS